MSECQGCDTCPFTETVETLHYEIHVTVDHRETFVDDCYAIGVKPVIIDMGDDVPTHSMTSSTLKDSNDTAAFVTAHSIAKALEDIGYDVERIKIETVPWHPKTSNPEPEQYFETHFAFKVEGDGYMLNQMLKMAKWLHPSRNLLKKGEDRIQMVTYRRHDVDSKTYLESIDDMQKVFLDNHLKLDKVITEFALYDTNERMDDPWLRSSFKRRKD
jgi:hypothetical protein